MTAWNAITVVTSDHGPVEILCPDWCTGDGHPDGHQRDDICHRGDDTVITVDTPRGPIELFTLGLAQDPYTSRPVGTGVYVAVYFAATDGWATSPADLDQLAVRIGEAVIAARHEVQRLAAQAFGGEDR